MRFCIKTDYKLTYKFCMVSLYMNNYMSVMWNSEVTADKFKVVEICTSGNYWQEGFTVQYTHYFVVPASKLTYEYNDTSEGK